jgi:hypothetical protein
MSQERFIDPDPITLGVTILGGTLALVKIIDIIRRAINEEKQLVDQRLSRRANQTLPDAKILFQEQEFIARELASVLHNGDKEDTSRDGRLFLSERYFTAYKRLNQTCLANTSKMHRMTIRLETVFSKLIPMKDSRGDHDDNYQQEIEKKTKVVTEVLLRKVSTNRAENRISMEDNLNVFESLEDLNSLGTKSTEELLKDFSEYFDQPYDDQHDR